jgi:prophage regulatory protein
VEDRDEGLGAPENIDNALRRLTDVCVVTGWFWTSIRPGRTVVSHQPSPKIERLPAVLARTGLSRSSVYSLLAAGGFPPPIKLSARSIGFLSAEIDEWIAGRAAAREAAGA